MKKEYLSEEKYLQSNARVKKIGRILIIVGLCIEVLSVILIVCGFLGFGNQVVSGIENGHDDVSVGGIFGGFGLFAIGGFLGVPGLPLLVIGFVLRFLIGNRREIVAYTAQQTMPLAQEGIEKMAPTIGGAAKEIAKGIKEGINEANEK